MSNKKYQHPLFILALATISCFLWGSAFPSIKYSYSLLDIAHSSSIVKMQFAGYRFLLASIYLFIIILILHRPISISKNLIPHLVLLGSFQTSLQYYFFYNGLANVTGIKGSIISSLGTFFAVIFPHFYYKNEKLTIQKLLGLMLGFFGVIYINLSKGSITGGFTLTGEGFLILGAIISAISAIMAKEISQKVDSLIMTCYQMFIGSIIMLTFSFTQTGGTVFTTAGVGLLLIIVTLSFARQRFPRKGRDLILL